MDGGLGNLGEFRPVVEEDSDTMEMIQWLRSKICLKGYDDEMWDEQHDSVALEFLAQIDAKRMIAYMSDSNELVLLVPFTAMAVSPVRFMYFVKKHDDRITPDNVRSSIQFGFSNGTGMDSLLRLMKHVHVPRILGNSTWPDSVKKDFTAQLQRFMASLVETANQTKGKTVLYIPDGDESLDASAAADKDVVQRLESTVIHWTRQIKEVISNQEGSAAAAETSGPLEEIEFWRRRTVDLSGIREQLEHPAVTNVVVILEAAKSSYLDPFKTRTQMIQQGSEEANDNLRFLELLDEPCTKLHEAEPKDVGPLLPGILSRIRVIANVSHHYNSDDRLTGLLRKISNEIIHRCREKIQVDDIFDGDVLRAVSALKESIECGQSWASVYRDTVESIRRSGRGRPWSFDRTAIFAQMDAFVQRCRDLLEVCEGQIQFARKRIPGGEKAPLPAFGGSKAPEVVRSLDGIETTFEQRIGSLRPLKNEILDVKSTAWHDACNSFKAGVKDLEVMLQNVINAAFEGVATTAAGVELLEAFASIAELPAIHRAVERKTSEVYALFMRQMAATKMYFEEHRVEPPLGIDEPHYAGAALWAHGLLQGVEQNFKLLSDAHYLPKKGFAADAEAAFRDTTQGFEEYMQKQYRDWMAQLSGLDQNALQDKLKNPLLIRVATQAASDVKDRIVHVQRNSSGYLQCNFDRDLLSLFSEVHHWEKFQGKFMVPFYAQDICTNQQDKLRTLREYVMIVVRDYNQIIASLSSDERKLFRESIKRLDRRIMPGLSKLTWTSDKMVEWYVKDCRKHCAEAYRLVVAVHRSKAEIETVCKRLASTLLLNIQKNYVYEDGVFEDKQSKHCEEVRGVLKESHERMKEIMKDMYEFFRDDPNDVQREWASYVKRIDRKAEEALRSTVKKSLTELSKAINGDSKRAEPAPLFKISVVLENNRVEFRPSMMVLTKMVNRVCKEMISCIDVVPRLSQRLVDEIGEYKAAPFARPRHAAVENTGVPTMGAYTEPEPVEHDLQSFYDIVSNDSDILNIVMNIMNGMGASQQLISKSLSYWDQYQELWETDKMNYMWRYAKSNRPLQQFEADIQGYRNHLNNIATGEMMDEHINFVQLDSSPLKQSLVEHCQQWQRLLTDLLNDIARKELDELTNLMAENTQKLLTKPLNLHDYSDTVHLLQNLQKQVPSIEARFEPLEERYEVLKKFDVPVAEREVAMLGTLRERWAEFKESMAKSGSMLSQSRTAMKKDVQDALENFTGHVSELRATAAANLPFDSTYNVSDALGIIQEFRDSLQKARAKEGSLKPGLELFEIPAPEYAELQDLDKELDHMEAMWGLTRDWDEAWSGWKTGKFRDLDAEVMEASAAQFNKQIGKLRDLKKWGVWQDIRNRVDQFRKTMPLIMDLRNPAMRVRHWDDLREEIEKNFDPNADDFTLEAVFDLGLHNHADFIGELSANANKELAIEQSLQKVREAWADIDIDMTEYKEVYHKIRSTEDLFQQLEDDQVNLSTVKGSRFYASFQTDIDYWEKTLSLISEVIELLLNVQRQWMYLESIFMSSDDIRRQLPKETTLFDQVNKSYVMVTERMHADPNAVRACSQDGVLGVLNTMDEKLETIQKSLDQYLETKRKRFPRFYFLSNDDLLEILGQSRDPQQVQKHIKKCFEGIKALQMQQSTGKTKNWECVGMNAPDGEKVPFVGKVIADGPVEEWLIKVEMEMIRAVQHWLGKAITGYKGAKEKWIKDYPGQLLITTGMIAFSSNCTKALNQVANGSKNAMKVQRKKQVVYLSRLSDIVRQPIEKIMRSKLVALITIELHSRDVMERMIKAGCSNVTDFEWLAQLRLYFRKDEGEFGLCHVEQTNCTLTFGYEYQGNNGRLVVTPLTDRCVLTLTTALSLQRGGAPAGPAGTGKTETVKDLGKNLAKFVVVFNCSDGLDYKSVGRMFSGLVQSGGWGCFDEFNRIEIEVLSVIAQQISAIMAAIKARKTEFLYMDSIIRCNWNCGIFITMNPGYAGRTELPDNLKSLFRPVAMMVPDLALIAEVMLQAEGFLNSRLLAKKTVTLYGLMVQQLSKQDHYDYGLRSLRGVLVAAGSLKRAEPEENEEYIMLRAIRDMNSPKFIKADAELFRHLLGDLFPSLELPPFAGGDLGTQLELELKQQGLQNVPIIVQKCVELRDSKATRHCNMLVGRTLSGKSVVWKTLAAARTTLAKQGVDGYMKIRHEVINPKSISMNELYGAYDLQTMEWTDGILSSVFRGFARDEKEEEKWLILDGPVDTLWIESMNTVMDDNKTLTLINGDRISMNNYMSLVFEVQDLAVASPATVSRAGMIYVDVDDLGWQPFVTSWIEKRFEQPEIAKLWHDLFQKYMHRLFEAKRTDFEELVKTTDFTQVISFCHLLDAFVTPENGCDRVNDMEHYPAMVEKWFAFCLTWSLGGSLAENGRVKFNEVLRDIENLYPPMKTVYSYYIDVKGREFKPWSDKVSANWKPAKDTPFAKLMVPTVDTVRNAFVLRTLLQNGHNALLVGNTGTGKTILAQQLLDELNPETHLRLVMNFSAATSSVATQDIIEGVMEKRAKDKMGPPGGRKMIAFVDDLNMPKKDTFGSQPPLELLRQWNDYGGWYDRTKQAWRFILDMQLLAAMGPPGGGRSAISERFQSRFTLINFTFPAVSQVKRIFECILAPKMAEFEDEIKPLTAPIVAATVAIYDKVLQIFLPTPQKSHYLFNLRDIARVTQGILRSHRTFIESKEAFLRLWAHECMRVFADRFTSIDDVDRFRGLIDEQLVKNLGTSYVQVTNGFCESPEAGPVFCDFISPPLGDSGPPYEEATDLDKLKAMLEDKLTDYNMEPGFLPMELVLFRDAIRHVCRIQRIMRTPRGNALLVGVGGSGRQSLTRLAAWVSEMKVFQIEITKQYRSVEFHEDLKKLYTMAGVENKATVFLFTDTQIKEESFLEDVNNILSSGEVPNLYPKDEKVGIIDAMRPVARQLGVQETADDMWALFIDRVRENLHVVLCMSPIGDAFRNRTRMYPSLVNSTTIDWFHEWPAEALQEVALRFLEQMRFGSSDDNALKEKVSSVFASAHKSVITASGRMLLELKRNNYVTPTNYLELVRGYRELMVEKRQKLGDARDKLQNGLTKLDESREQVEEMQVELAEKQKIVAQKTKDCEDLLVVIVSERRVADEQKKQVEAESERIGKEEKTCKEIAADAEADLGKALPALEKAMAEVDKLDKGSISEVKAYSKPPAAVEMVLSAVMIMFGKATDWATAKKTISDANFLTKVKTFDKDSVPTSTLTKVRKYTSKPDFKPEIVRASSAAAAALCVWVNAIEIYCNVFRQVAPKRAKLKAAMDELGEKQASLAESKARLAEVIAKVDDLKQRHEASEAEKNTLLAEAELLQLKLNRAEKLVGGLSGEKVRWTESIKSYDAQILKLPGDALVAAAFLSYAGPFDTSYRAKLLSQWLAKTKELEIPFTKGFSFSEFLADPTDVRDWNIWELPKDDFSTENGVIVTRGRRWPLMVDPQGQAKRWVQNMEEKNQLKVTDLKSKNFLRDLENAIVYGLPYLLQDVEEELDPALEPVLTKSIVKQGTREILRLGDSELDYSQDFRLYITTKLPNPHYTPEVSTKTTIVNFAVKEEGLEAQLLGIVVQEEKPELEEQKSELVVNVANGKRKLVELENEILRLLSTAEGSLLDDEELVNTLQVSKTTSEEVTESLKIAEETEIEIDKAREGYRAVSIRASLLYFVLNDLSRVDPMYQFSLDAYVLLFIGSIRDSKASISGITGITGLGGGADELKHRIEGINNWHTLQVYKYACRGLFEKDKLLLSLQICVRKMEREGKIARDEYEFFLKGGTVVDRSEQASNPCSDWLTSPAWDNITEVDKLAAFTGIIGSFEQLPRDWRQWYMSSRPEREELPAEWQAKLSDLQRMVVLRSLRPDRVLQAVTIFVSNNLGADFVTPPAFDLRNVLESSDSRTPLVFVLSPGVDPTKEVDALAKSLGVRLQSCSLGQGQAPVATRMIEEGLEDGSWVFLQNCHLSISWMPALEKIVENYCTKGDPHPEFRLWLSSSPHPKFPIAILQRGIKMTTEPPRGLKPNLIRLYNLLSEEQFNRCAHQEKYKKLLFCLCWFHAVLIERRKFKALGWNIPYEFNNSDFAICEDILAVYLDTYPDTTPWDAIRYLIAEANYGGRITDDWDRRLCNVYVAQYFCEDALAVPNFRLAELDEYHIPEDGDLQSYKDFIEKSLPADDPPEAFGQHPNADIQSAIQDSTDLLATVISLQPRVVTEGGESNEDKVLAIAGELERQTPPVFDMHEVKTTMVARSDPDPLKTVLVQEIDRYNALLAKMAASLHELQRGIQGLVVITPELEGIFSALLVGTVPAAWSFCYPSLKPLGAWMRELVDRIEQMRFWAETEMPKVFWLSGFTYPTGFLTAVLQTSARKNGVAIDSLSWEFPVLKQTPESITQHPKEGAYVRGMFLEGARWDDDNGCLTEPEPMELFSPMPMIHFKPVENKKKGAKGMYLCPLYMYPVRTGTRERPSFMIAVDLKSGAHGAEFWTKRGTALLLTLAN